MYIAIQCDIYACMPKNLTKTFYVKTKFNASCGECVTQRMKIHVLDAALFSNRFEMVFHASRLDKAMNHSSQKKCIPLFLRRSEQLHNIAGNWDVPDRTIALRWQDDDFGFPFRAVVCLDSLHCLMNIEILLTDTDVIPFHCADFSYAKSGIETQ